ncbi:MAG: DNA repair protein RecO [Planctomycetia bacterium]|nr:DNA repair protein RecO [Planctomycetia bacterium]
MSAEKATALVLRAVEFSETSYVLTLWTREFGRISALAKGARRPKAPFDSALDLLTVCRILFLRKTSGGLDLLTEARLERRFRPPHGDLARLYAGYYVAELLLSLTDEYDPHPELFDLADATLVELAQVRLPVAAIVLRFEWMALRLLGHLPLLSACVECATPVPAAGRVAFSALAGGVLCPRCRGGKRNVISLSAAAIEAMSTYAEPDHTPDAVPDAARWKTMQLEKKTRAELRGVLNNYLSHLLGHRPQMHDYLGFLGQ